MSQNTKQTIYRIGISSIGMAVWLSVVLFLSAITPSSEISPIYFWIKTSTLIVSFGAVACLVVRSFNKLDQTTNFIYTLLATSNFVFGILGLAFYLLGKINFIGLHNLLFNLLLGILLFADIFFFNFLFKRT